MVNDEAANQLQNCQSDEDVEAEEQSSYLTTNDFRSLDCNRYFIKKIVHVLKNYKDNMR